MKPSIYLALPVLGAIPKLPKAEMGKNKLVAAEDSNSAGAEVFRTLRTTLSMLGREKDRRTYLFTSSLPGEGKTFTSLNYSASLAQQGLRTLLVDVDLRRPMLEDFFTGQTPAFARRHRLFFGTQEIRRALPATQGHFQIILDAQRQFRAQPVGIAHAGGFSTIAQRRTGSIRPHRP